MAQRVLLAADFKPVPVWRESLPAVQLGVDALPDRVETAVIGAGFTGLMTALQLARGGREVLILEADEPGAGCSTRNGGQVSSEMHRDLATLARTLGEERARRVLQAGRDAHQFLRAFIAQERIDCDYEVCGHFIGAHAPDRLGFLERFAANQQDLGTEARLVARAEQRQYCSTDSFYGGLSLPDWSSLHPGRYHRALLERVVKVGVRICRNTRVTGIEQASGAVQIATTRGPLQARDAVLATDGYTDRACSWMQRRIVAVPSFVIVSEQLDPALVERLFPGRRMVYDTRLNVTYSRPLPGGTRVLFGTVVRVSQADPMASIGAAHANMVRQMPDLASAKVSYAWYGMVGATFDRLPHIGNVGRLHYAIGYNGTGIAMSSFLGTMLARQMLGDRTAATGLDTRPFPTRPLYTGRPWFRGPLLFAHRIRDALPQRFSL